MPAITQLTEAANSPASMQAGSSIGRRAELLLILSKASVDDLVGEVAGMFADKPATRSAVSQAVRVTIGFVSHRGGTLAGGLEVKPDDFHVSDRGGVLVSHESAWNH